MASKLDFDGKRMAVNETKAVEVMTAILGSLGCDIKAASMIADHLADASLCGVESYGVMRILQYARQFRSGYMTATGRPQVSQRDG